MVTVAAWSATGTPVATSALKSRAPSMCTGRPSAAACTACRAASSQGVPPEAMWVFSTQTNDTTGWW